MPDRPTLPPVESTPSTVVVELPPNSRTTVALHELTGFRGRVGTLVESIGPGAIADIVVERATYWDAGGQPWAAGTNLLATPLP